MSLKWCQAQGGTKPFIVRGLLMGFRWTYKEVDFIHPSSTHFMCPCVHVLGWSLEPWKFHSTSKGITWCFSSLRKSMCQRQKAVKLHRIVRLCTEQEESVQKSTHKLNSSLLLTYRWMLTWWWVCLLYPLHVESLPLLLLTSCMWDS